MQLILSSAATCVEVKGEANKDIADKGKKTPLLKLCLKLVLILERN
jgi:hypothetical protein